MFTLLGKMKFDDITIASELPETFYFDQILPVNLTTEIDNRPAVELIQVLASNTLLQCFSLGKYRFIYVPIQDLDSIRIFLTRIILCMLLLIIILTVQFTDDMSYDWVYTKTARINVWRIERPESQSKKAVSNFDLIYF